MLSNIKNMDNSSDMAKLSKEDVIFLKKEIENVCNESFHNQKKFVDKFVAKYGINQEIEDGENLFYYFCKFGNSMKIIDYLVSLEIVKLSIFDICHFDVDVVKSLLKYYNEEELNMKNEDGDTVLLSIIKNGNILLFENAKILEMLLNNSLINVNIVDKDGKLPIVHLIKRTIYSSYYDYKIFGRDKEFTLFKKLISQIFIALFDKMVDLNFKTSDNKTLLHLLCESKNVDYNVLDHYLKIHEGVDLNAIDNYKRIPINYVDNWDKMECLLKYPVNLNYDGDWHGRVLDKWWDREQIMTLIRHGARSYRRNETMVLIKEYENSFEFRVKKMLGMNVGGKYENWEDKKKNEKDRYRWYNT